MGDRVKVAKLPPCDIHGGRHAAEYDARTKQGSWAFMCREAFLDEEISFHRLGTGWGQYLYVE